MKFVATSNNLEQALTWKTENWFNQVITVGIVLEK